MTTEGAAKKETSDAAITRVFEWVKGAHTRDLSARVAMDIGIMIGRIHQLEEQTADPELLRIHRDVEIAWREVVTTLNWQHREGIISYDALKAGVNNAGHIRRAVHEVE